MEREGSRSTTRRTWSALNDSGQRTGFRCGGRWTKMRWNMGGTSGATILCVIAARAGRCGVTASVTFRQPSRVGKMFPEEEYVGKTKKHKTKKRSGVASGKRKRGRVRAVVAAPGIKVRAAVGESGDGESGWDGEHGSWDSWEVRKVRTAFGIHGKEGRYAGLVHKNTRGRCGQSTRRVKGSVDGRAFMKTTRGGNSLSCDRRGFGVGHGKRVYYQVMGVG